VLLFLLLPLAVDDFWVCSSPACSSSGLLAWSFDLVWGIAGHSFVRQALFFGVAGYSLRAARHQSRVTSILLLLPLAAVVGLVVSVALASDHPRQTRADSVFSRSAP